MKRLLPFLRLDFLATSALDREVISLLRLAETVDSDDWVLEETPIKLPAPKGMDARSQRRWLSGRLRKELLLADTERRIREAEATIAKLKEQYAKDRDAWEKQKAAEAERAKTK